MANVLLLGPDPQRVKDIRNLLRRDGHQVTAVPDVGIWRAREREVVPEVVVAAVESVRDVLSVSERPVRGFPAPLLFVQQETDFFRDMHLDDRLVDRIASPFVGEELLGRVDALVRVRRVIHRDPKVSGKADSRGRPGSGLAGRLASILGARLPGREKPLLSYLEVAARVAQWADRRDAFEPGHAERVTSLCAMIGDEMGLPDTESAALLRAAMLHDIGKVAMPVEVLHQREPLQESQLRLIRTHPRRGAALLSALDKDEEVAAAILYHHERPDGKGYYGLRGRASPRAARILAVSEVYDAMTSSRIKKKMPSGQALEKMQSSRGASLDAECVDALIAKLRPRTGSGTIPLAVRI